MSYQDTLSKYSVNPNIESTVTVGASGCDYTSIKAAVAGVTPTVLAPIKIYVLNGTYEEIQIDGKSYLTIEGQSKAGVIINSDGLRTDVDPVSGQRYCDMVYSAKHGIKTFHQQFKLKNLTWRVNDVKYVVHADQSSPVASVPTYMYFENCHFATSPTALSPIGMGLRDWQYAYFTDCTVERLGAQALPAELASHGIYCHNWNDQTGTGIGANCRLFLTRCNSINCGLLTLDELGSEHTDLAILTDCTTDASGNSDIKYTGSNTYWNGGGQDVLTMPYDWNVLMINTPLTYEHDDAVRPDYANVVYSI